MNKRVLYPVVVLIAALLLCGLRVAELSVGFESLGDTSVVVEGSAVVAATRIVAVVAAAALSLLVLTLPDLELDYPAFSGGVGKLPSVLAGFLLVAAGAFGLVSHMGNTVRMILSLFSLLAGGTVVLALKSKGGALAVVPVFFGCFLLLALYVEHSGDAALERYGYSVLAAAAGTAAFYCAASASFGVTRARFKLAASGLTVLLSLMSAVSELSAGDVQLAGTFLALAVFAGGVVCGICLKGPEGAPASEGTADGDEE